MSQMTATAEPLRAPRKAPTAAPLRVIPARITTSGNGAFASLCIAMLTVGLVSLLLLNTALAQGSVAVGQLQSESTSLADQAGILQEEIDRASASGALAKAATRLGMVRANERGYIDVRTGTVTGEALPAGKGQAFTVVTSPTPVPKPPAPKPATAPPATKPAATKPPATSGTTASGTAKPSATKPVTKPVTKPSKPATGASKPAQTSTGTR